MAEWRVAHVVGQTRSRNDGTDFCDERCFLLAILINQMSCYIVAQGATYARNLQTVRQAVVDADVARQGENLRLVLHSAEWSRKNQTVIVALEVRAVLVLLVVIVFQSKSFGGD